MLNSEERDFFLEQIQLIKAQHSVGTSEAFALLQIQLEHQRLIELSSGQGQSRISISQMMLLTNMVEAWLERQLRQLVQDRFESEPETLFLEPEIVPIPFAAEQIRKLPMYSRVGLATPSLSSEFVIEINYEVLFLELNRLISVIIKQVSIHNYLQLAQILNPALKRRIRFRVLNSSQWLSFQDENSTELNNLIDEIVSSSRLPPEKALDRRYSAQERASYDEALRNVAIALYAIACGFAPKYESRAILNSGKLFQRFENEMTLGRISSEREIAIAVAYDLLGLGSIAAMIAEYQGRVAKNRIEVEKSVIPVLKQHDEKRLRFKEYALTALISNRRFLSRYFKLPLE